jgi:deoxyribodipyrimidine photolyase
VLTAARITLSKTYPDAIVDHAAARLRALKAFEYLKQDKKALSLKP